MANEAENALKHSGALPVWCQTGHKQRQFSRLAINRTNCMKKYPKQPLTPEQAEKFYQPFPITSVCRADLVEGFKISEMEALNVSDDEMQEIARKLADAYCDNGFWIDLPIIAEYVLKERGA